MSDIQTEYLEGRMAELSGENGKLKARIRELEEALRLVWSFNQYLPKRQHDIVRRLCNELKQPPQPTHNASKPQFGK